MFASKDDLYFLIGLGSFLVAHFNYFLAFKSEYKASGKKGLIIQKPYVVYVVVLVAGVMNMVILQFLSFDMYIPVTAYSTAIIFMVVAALNRKGIVSPKSFQLVIYGAALFVISDACIAVNKFIAPFPKAGVVIMITYILAQYLIVQGAILSVWGTDTKTALS